MPRVWPIGQMRCAFAQMRRLVKCALQAYIVTKAVYPEAEALGFEAEAEAVDPEAARQYINKSHIWAVSLKRKENKHFLT